MKKKKELNDELLIALKNRDFDKVKELVKNGVKPIGNILQTASYENRLDVFEYFLFSNEIPINIDVKVKYDKIWGEASTFRYACLGGAIDIVRFIVEDSRVCNEFDFEKYAFNITYGLLSKSPNDSNFPIKPVLDFVLNHEKLRYIEQIKQKKFKLVKDVLDWETRVNHTYGIEYLINNLEYRLVKEIKPIVLNYKNNSNKKQYESLFIKRETYEDLKNDLNVNNSVIKPFLKI